MTNEQVKASIASNLPDNTVGAITPAKLRGELDNMVDYSDTSVGTHNSDPAAHGTLFFSGVPKLVSEHPEASNPVLNASSVTDRTAQGVADPFIVYENGVYYAFFEVITATTEEIGYAISYDGLVWNYQEVCLTETGVHFAYPFVFKQGGDWYMIPDMTTECSIYKASNFPTGWVKLRTVFESGPVADTTPFQYNGVWYIYTQQSHVLRLYYTTDIISGDWSEHPASPISEVATDRGAGMPVVTKDCVWAPIQGYITMYGEYAKWLRISNLTTTTATFTWMHRIVERDNTKGHYASRGRHHISQVGDLCLVDAVSATGTNNWSIAVFIANNKKRNPSCKIANTAGIQTLSGTNTWERAKAGEITGDVLSDNAYMWDATNKHVRIDRSGRYRILACFNEYGITSARACRIRVRNKVGDVVIATSGINIPSGGPCTQPNSLRIDCEAYLVAGAQLTVELYSNVLSVFDTGESNAAFSVTMVD